MLTICFYHDHMGSHESALHYDTRLAARRTRTRPYQAESLCHETLTIASPMKLHLSSRRPSCRARPAVVGAAKAAEGMGSPWRARLDPRLGDAVLALTAAQAELAAVDAERRQRRVTGGAGCMGGSMWVLMMALPCGAMPLGTVSSDLFEEVYIVNAHVYEQPIRLNRLDRHKMSKRNIFFGCGPCRPWVGKGRASVHEHGGPGGTALKRKKWLQIFACVAS